jgi:hypothetical protein
MHAHELNEQSGAAAIRYKIQQTNDFAGAG